jgi:hypothetical protein
MKKTLPFLILGIFLGGTIAFASTKTFPDIPANSWYKQAVENLSEREIIQGYPDREFKPRNNVNRAELAVILDRFSDKIVGRNLNERKTCFPEQNRTGLFLNLYDQNGKKLSGANVKMISQKFGNITILEDQVFNGHYTGSVFPKGAKGYFDLSIEKNGHISYLETVKIELDDCEDQITLNRTVTLTKIN